MLKRFSFLFSFVLNVWVFCYAAIPAFCFPLPPDEILHSLADNPGWQKLLYFDPKKSSSTVLSDDFFLTENGRHDPVAELAATISAYDQNIQSGRHQGTDTDPQCRFPARYFWLSKQLRLPDYQDIPAGCGKLTRWEILNSTKSISVLMVSGFLGNPASTFGHAMLTFNSGTTEGIDLFDSTLSYGALVPEGENTIVYVAKGLFGGYIAGFSDKYFYTQDLVYSHTEFRDIWEYRLHLSDDEQKLLILHLWEIAGKQFAYFFLNKNCAYMLAQFLDIALDDHILEQTNVWYAPNELFFRLADVDKKRKQQDRSPLIDFVTFIPSSQRLLQASVKTMDTTTNTAFANIIHSDFSTFQQELDTLEIQQKINLLDCLMTYLQYQKISQGKHLDPNIQRNTLKILQTRYSLPIQKPQKGEVASIDAPTEGAAPMQTGISVATTSTGETSTILHLSQYKYDLLGLNSLDKDELVVGDLALGYSYDENSIFIDSFDILKITHLNTLATEFDGQSPWSWQLQIGLKRASLADLHRLDGSIGFGGGFAWALTDQITPYFMIDASGHTQESYLRLTPQLGFLGDFGRFKTLIILKEESDGYEGRFDTQLDSSMQYNFSPNHAFSIKVDYQQEDFIYSAGFSYSF